MVVKGSVKVGKSMADASRKETVVLLVTRQGMGYGDLSLQQELFAKYLRLLDENQMLPGAICFYTEGVKLVVEGSPVLEHLQSLADRGVVLLICQTCLNHYGLLDKVKVGSVGGMPAIVAAQWAATKVITI
jgi:hypothetical protein